MTKEFKEAAKEMFEQLYTLNVNQYTEKKNGLTYLSWSYAWGEFKNVYPDATYEIKKCENNMPFVFDERTGYMVFTSVTAGDLTYEMWLPVMDSANKAMKDKPYTYDTKYKKDVLVEAATMFDINKTIMRCLVKNLAMFGLGLYIYSGEDLPEEIEKPVDETTIKLINELATKYAEPKGRTANEIITHYLNKFKVKKLDDLGMTTANLIAQELSNSINRRERKCVS